MIVTTKKLRDAGACDAYLTRFRRRFPNGVRVTQTTCVKYAAVFNWVWAIEHLVPGDFSRNREAFMVLTNQARAEWRDAVLYGPLTQARERQKKYCEAQARAFAKLVQYPRLRELRRSYAG